MMDTSTSTDPTDRPIRLIEYLYRLATLRSKQIHDIDRYEKVLWLSSVPREQGCFTQAWGSDEEHEPDVWLEARNRHEPELPTIPIACTEWVDETLLRRKSEPPELYHTVTKQEEQSQSEDDLGFLEIVNTTEYLVDYPEIQVVWGRYIQYEWTPWRDEHNVWQQVYDVYSALFTIHQEQQRLGEEYELVLGLGLLLWKTPSGYTVRRHLIVADAFMDFEARLGKFTIGQHNDGARIRPELDMLDIEEQPAHVEETAKDSLAEAGENPWEYETIEGVLQSLVHTISSTGEYNDSIDAKNVRVSTKPVVVWAPALILRKRSMKGLTETLRQIRERLEEGEFIPSEFADLAEIRTDNDTAQNGKDEEVGRTFDGEIYFPKPSNDEQRQIIDKIQSSNGVLVQGPPGTGKSHTIANLVSHFLATGQRTLITAKTPRALQVLEQLIPAQLRPLCINLLGSGHEERRSLEASVGGILRKYEEWDEQLAQMDILDIESRLRSLREERATIDRRLRTIRESETHTHTLAKGVYSGTAAQIAKAVNSDREKYDWFTDTAELERSCPVATDDLHRIFNGFCHFTPKRRSDLALAWPQEVLSSSKFDELVEDEALAIETEQEFLEGADDDVAKLLSSSGLSTVQAVQAAVSEFHDSCAKLESSPHEWMKQALLDILGGSPNAWRTRFKLTKKCLQSTYPLAKHADASELDYPTSVSLRALYDDACALRFHLENGGKLGRGPFRPKVVKQRRYLIDEVRINGHTCTTVEEFSLLCNILHVRIETKKAWAFWEGLTPKTHGPYTLQLETLYTMHVDLAEALSLRRKIRTCEETLQQVRELDPPRWSDAEEVETLLNSCSLAIGRIQRTNAEAEFNEIAAPVQAINDSGTAHPQTVSLYHAIQARDSKRYRKACNQIVELERDREQLDLLSHKLADVQQVLPKLADVLVNTCSDPQWNERLEHIDEAWRWAQARYWVEDYIRQEDVPALSIRFNQVEKEIGLSIADLASLRAWSFCFSRLNENHRRHMEAWQQSMRRLGKGTGKHAPRHRREAQEHLNQCREAVPAWVMPVHRIWDTVRPEPGMFDVVIVDEASQCGFEALPLLYLGKKILIVGDDKQISPDAVGLARDAVVRNMNEYLYDFEYRTSFDVENSLFDHGKLRYGASRITLREHFRCMPEIIRFSNDLCYSDTPLIPLRQYGPDRLEPLESVFVEGGYREGSASRTINRPEAQAIVERLVQICDDSRYDGKSMGVVVLQGNAQAQLIEDMLLERIGAEEMEKRRLVCGNPYSFQGGERDIMLLSLVSANNARIGPLTRAADERRFNVAASRARDQMILFHSVTEDDLSVYGIRRRLLEFFHNRVSQQTNGLDQVELEQRAIRDNRAIVKPPAPFDSWFEVDVALELLRRDYIIQPQYEVARKRIDLVVEGGQARLAVECDGDYWHGADQYEADMQRQRQLERCGWEFFRVRESTFYIDRAIALTPLWHVLEERGIFPSHPIRTSHIVVAESDIHEGQ